MSLTGLGGIAYLVMHMLGNLVVYEGPATFNGYAEGLHSLPFLPLLEAALVGLFLFHILLGIILTLQNWAARPITYAKLANHGAKTFASTTMIYTGLTILAFMLFHVWSVRISPSEGTPVFDRVKHDLTIPLFACIYAVGLVAVGLHLSHGASSCLLSLGLRHQLHDPWVDLLGKVAATVMALAFGTIVFCFLFFGGPTASLRIDKSREQEGRVTEAQVNAGGAADRKACPGLRVAEGNGP